MNNGDQPAYPFTTTFANGETNGMWDGLTKREYFAAMAMQGLCANPGFYQNMIDSRKVELRYIAITSLECADALIAELAKTKLP